MFKLCSPKQVQSFQLGKSLSLIIVTTYFIPVLALAITQIEVNKSSKTVNTDLVAKTGEFQPILPMGNIKNISSPFGRRLDPFTGFLEHHQGVDYPAANGTPILATANGTITQAGYNGGYGNLVEIDHGQGYTSKYGHASQILVRVGQQVKKGQVIALVGSTGYSTGPHLHFEIAQHGQAFNPLAFMTEGLQLESTYSLAPYSGKGTTYINNYASNSKNTKPYYTTGDMVVAVRVRSSKTTKW
jgi:murein DD-endopeptidase MepM/ murein hydrolase activator NlpD